MKISYVMFEGTTPEWEQGLVAELTQVGWTHTALAAWTGKVAGRLKVPPEVANADVIVVSASAALDVLELLRKMAPKKPIVALLDNQDDKDELLAMFAAGATMFVDVLSDQEIFHAQLRAFGTLLRKPKPAPPKPTRTMLVEPVKLSEKEFGAGVLAPPSAVQDPLPPKTWKQPKSYGFSTPDRHEGDEDGAPQPDV